MSLTAPRLPRKSILGLPVVPSLKDSAILETRTVRMPGGTPLVCRRRVMLDGSSEWWTAEIPLGLAAEVYDEG